MRINDLSGEILDASIEVHRHLGPGLLESAYEECLCYELASRGFRFRRQVHLPVLYKEVALECGYRLDILVEELIVLELKSVAALESVHTAQVLTYLKLSKYPLGLLINFNVGQAHGWWIQADSLAGKWHWPRLVKSPASNTLLLSAPPRLCGELRKCQSSKNC